MKISDIFSKLKKNPSGHVFTLENVPNHKEAFIGIDQGGHPWLFVKAKEASSNAPLCTSQITLYPAQEYNIYISKIGTFRELLYGLRCDSHDLSDIGNFLILIEAFIDQHRKEKIDGGKLSDFFHSMVRLFSVKPAKDIDAERQGLWAELFFMRQIKGYAFWASFWHNEPTRTFDFSTKGKRLEIKSTTGNQRIHHFSHRQIYALEDEEIAIASLILRKDDAGLTLRDLVNECRKALLGTAHFFRLERAVRSARMEDPSLRGPTFDQTEAKNNLLIFSSIDTPHFPMPEPSGVSETRYKVDLSNVQSLDEREIKRWIGSWKPS